MAVVKANAYGHGAVPVSKVLVQAGVERLGVALVEEGIELCEAGVSVPIHLLVEPQLEEVPRVLEYGLIPTVYSWPLAEALSGEARQRGREVKVHLKVDTGMNRVGVPFEKAPYFIEKVASLSNLQIEGVFTHFARADEPESNCTLSQLERFQSVLDKLAAKGLLPPLRHAANSAASILFPKSRLEMVRVGLALYGLHPSSATQAKVDLKPVLSWKARIGFLKEVPAGEGVSYGHSFTTKRSTKIATLNLGYADGYSRLLSDRSEVLIKGKRCPVVGRVCMDQIMVDVTDLPTVSLEDEVVIVGTQGNETVSVDELAQIMETINYEVACGISSRVPRFFVGEKAEGF